MEDGQELNQDNHRIRILHKVNFKGEKAVEYSVKGNTQEEIETLIAQVQQTITKYGLR